MLLSLLLAALPATAGRAIPDSEFMLVQSEDEVDAIRGQAIERSVQSVTWLFRGFARNRLNAVTTACPAYRLIIREPDFEVRCDGETVFAWTLGRSGMWTTETGDDVHVTLIEQPRSFTLRFQAAGGAKTFTYTHREDGSLRVTQQIDSSRLPVPVRYSLDYALPEGTRAEAQDAAPQADASQP